VNAYTTKIRSARGSIWCGSRTTTRRSISAMPHLHPAAAGTGRVTVNRGAGRDDQATAVLLNGPVRAEREHYFDAGILRTVIPARCRAGRLLQDEAQPDRRGQFGESLVNSPSTTGSDAPTGSRRPAPTITARSARTRTSPMRGEGEGHRLQPVLLRAGRARLYPQSGDLYRSQPGLDDLRRRVAGLARCRRAVPRQRRFDLRQRAEAQPLDAWSPTVRSCQLRPGQSRVGAGHRCDGR